MQDIGYEAVATVLTTWDAARRAHKGHFELDFGSLLVNKFVELQPRAKAFYKGDEMMRRHAEGIVHLLDSILQMLGPDVEFTQEILRQVGQQHAKMEVNVCFFPSLGESLLWALGQTVGDEIMTEDAKEAWQEVYDAISEEMIRAILTTA